jgi:hypothetical protein
LLSQSALEQLRHFLLILYYQDSQHGQYGFSAEEHEYSRRSLRSDDKTGGASDDSFGIEAIRAQQSSFQLISGDCR